MGSRLKRLVLKPRKFAPWMGITLLSVGFLFFLLFIVLVQLLWTDDIDLPIEYRVELMQALLIACTALLGLSSVFGGRNLFTVKQLNRALLSVSFFLGLLCIISIIQWFLTSTDNWILISIASFQFQLILFMVKGVFFP